MRHIILTIASCGCSALFAVFLYSMMMEPQAGRDNAISANNITVVDRNGSPCISMAFEHRVDDRDNDQSTPYIDLYNGNKQRNRLTFGFSALDEPHITMTSPNGESTARLLLSNDALTLTHSQSNSKKSEVIFDASKGTLTIQRHGMAPIIYK